MLICPFLFDLCLLSRLAVCGGGVGIIYGLLDKKFIDIDGVVYQTES